MLGSRLVEHPEKVILDVGSANSEADTRFRGLSPCINSSNYIREYHTTHYAHLAIYRRGVETFMGEGDYKHAFSNCNGRSAALETVDTKPTPVVVRPKTVQT